MILNYALTKLIHRINIDSVKRIFTCGIVKQSKSAAQAALAFGAKIFKFGRKSIFNAPNESRGLL